MPAVVGVPVIVLVVALAVEVNAKPGGSVPVIDHVAAVATVNAPELYAEPIVGFVNVVGDIVETVRV